MSNFKDAKIGDTIYSLDELTFDINQNKVSGIVLTDKSRKLYRIYIDSNKLDHSILVDENSSISRGGDSHYSMDLQKVTAKRRLIKEQKQAQLLKEIRLRVKILKKIDSDIESCKQRVMATFGQK